MVQKVVKLPDGSGINLTVAKYLTPNGNFIDKIGINPDYEVNLSEEDMLKENDTQLDKAKEILHKLSK